MSGLTMFDVFISLLTSCILKKLLSTDIGQLLVPVSLICTH